MKIKFLGTAAAEGIPALFCECEVCKKSRELGGKNIRSRSQALVDDKILIDFPADTFYHTIKYGVDLTKISTCLITHSHSDHLYPADFEMRRVDFCRLEESKDVLLTVYVGKSGADAVNQIVDTYNLSETNRVKVFEYKSFEPFIAEGYKITPLPASHSPHTHPHMFLIEKDGKAMMYAHDTSAFKQEVVDYLKNSGVKLDLISIDCTFATTDIRTPEHLCYDDMLMQIDRLSAVGAVTNDTIVVANHFAHNKTATYDDIISATSQDDVVISYDGLEIEF